MEEYGGLLKALNMLVNQDKGITFILSKEQEKYVTYKELWNRSASLCKALQIRGAQVGSEVVLQCKERENFIYGFWACVMGGFRAVPIDIGSNDYKSVVDEKIFSLLSKPFLLYDNTDNGNVQSPYFEGRTINLSLFDYNAYEESKGTIERCTNNIMYIQFSSGSTGNPKGAVIRHSNVIANANDIIERLQLTQNDLSLSWQPLTHCYGLIVFHIVPIVLGISQYFISAETYMQSPLLWLYKTDQHKITRLGTIPFALKHCMEFHKHSKESYQWDLSSVKSITIGGEQIVRELCKEFVDMMKPYGLGENVMCPIYGLAESTTGLSILKPGSSLIKHKIKREDLEIGKRVTFVKENSFTKGMSYIEQGEPLKTVEIKIVDNDNNSLPEGTIGHIYARGGNIASEYYHDPLSTKDAFLEDGWLDTGDIGYLYNKNIVVVGREKELIVVNGMKYMSVDIENIVKKNVAGCDSKELVACNGINLETGSEQALIFVKTSFDVSCRNEVKQFQELSNNIRETVYQLTGLTIEHVIPIQNIPKTFSGKIKRKELTNRFNEGDFKEMIDKLNHLQGENDLKVSIELMTKEKIQALIVSIIQDMFQIKVTDYDLAFKNYGIVSVNIPPFIERLNAMLQTNVQVSSFFNHPNINQFSKYVYKVIHENRERKEETMLNHTVKSEEDKVAIIGMSCRFPGGANSIEEYWDVLMKGIDGIIDVPVERWDREKYYDENDDAPGKMYCKKGGFLQTPIDEFDARFFNISPKEAMSLDPQQRLMLELTWEAFENANLDITKYKDSNTGVYLGMSTTEYMLANLYSGDLTRIDAYTLTGTCMSTACGRISYTFGFQGPCITVDTACSSALSAVHLACNAIKNGETNCCVVGGVNMMDSPAINVGFSKLHATAKDGHSKAFDASANGYGRSEGGGILLLKKLSDAERDGDKILGVICGTGINQDGKSNGLTAPNGESQTKLIRSTLAAAHLTPADIDYMEMHGTGTKLGDPIEVNAIVDAFGESKTKENPLKIGSVKSNIGHLEAGSGIASVIKVLLSMKHSLIPANLNFNNPNPFIDWDNAPVKVIDQHTEWIKDGIRRAGVSAFGFGGSNAHLIIEEYPQANPEQEQEQEGLNYLFKVSAKNEKSIMQYVENYVDYIKEHNDVYFRDIIYSADRSRADFDYRLCVSGKTKDEVLEKLEVFLDNKVQDGIICNFGEKREFVKERKVVFMFTGQGSQYVNMGKMLFNTNDVFRASMQECDKLFKPYILKSIIELLYGEKTSDELIQKTVYAQPLIFAIEYALYKMMENYGIHPEIVMGHSIGEYAAAVAAKIISLEDAVKLVSIRGRLMDSAPGSGAMGTIFASEEDVLAMIEPYKNVVSIAAHNAKDTCVISGDSKTVENILKDAEGKGIRISRLKVSHGFHSQLMEPILDDYHAIAEECTYATPQVRFISALYGKEIGENQVLGADYWTEHIRAKVDFYKAIMSIEHKEEYAFLEVGSHTVLSALCRLIFEGENVIAGTLSRKKTDAHQLAEALATLYVSGVDLDWSKMEFMGMKQWNRTQIPTYPYDKVKYWMDLVYDRKSSTEVAAEDVHQFLGQKIESPMMDNSVIFQNKYSGEKPFFMSEHIIFNTPIAPAASYVSMLISTMKELKNPASCTFKHIELREPLAIGTDEERLVQVCIHEDGEKEPEFSIVSKTINGSKKEWAIHTKGTVTVSQEYDEAAEQIDLEACNNMEFDFDAENGIYASMHSAGFDLGDSFRRITKTSVKDGKAVCFVEPLQTVPDLDMYELYPGVIDSIFQSMLCVVFEEFDADESRKGKKTTIPYYFDSITYNYRESKNLWCRVNAGMDQDIISGDIDIFNEDGKIIMMIRGFMTKLTNRENLLRGLKNANTGFYYHNDWIEQKAGKREKNNGERYVVIAGEEAVGQAVSEQLKAAGMDLCLLMAGENNQEGTLNAKDKAAWTGLLSQMRQEQDGIIKIIYCNETNGMEGLLNALHAIEELGFQNSCKIKIFTKNVQNVGDLEKLNLLQAPLWGFAKVIGIEYPGIFDGIVDFDEETLMNGGTVLADEAAGSSDKEVCLRTHGKRYVSRLKKLAESASKGIKKQDKIEMKEDASYLITGGTGALGLVYADCFIKNGAKNLILVSRHDPNKTAQSKIDGFREQGVTVEILHADVCKKEEFAQALQNVIKKMPLVKGVVHAAGTLHDKMISDQTWEDFETVLNPKVLGAMNVYESLAKEELDFFIMLSSITSVIGNVGQSNYAAANYFMNQFAEQMQKENVPGYTFCWGPWQGSGMASQSDATSKNMSNMGISPFSIETGTSIIEEFLEQPYTNLVVADIDWEIYVESLGNGAERYLEKVLKNNRKEESSQNKVNEGTVLEELKGVAKEERHVLLATTLQGVCGKIMGYGNGQVLDMDLTFNEQGVDSLMIFSMRNAINKMLGVDINVSTFFNYPTINKITDYLLNEELFVNDDEAVMSSESSTEDLLSELAGLTD